MTLDEIKAMLGQTNAARISLGLGQLTLVQSIDPGGMIFMARAEHGALLPAHSDPFNRKQASAFLHGQLNALAAALAFKAIAEMDD